MTGWGQRSQGITAKQNLCFCKKPDPDLPLGSHLYHEVNKTWIRVCTEEMGAICGLIQSGEAPLPIIMSLQTTNKGALWAFQLERDEGTFANGRFHRVHGGRLNGPHPRLQRHITPGVAMYEREQHFLEKCSHPQPGWTVGLSGVDCLEKCSYWMMCIRRSSRGQLSTAYSRCACWSGQLVLLGARGCIPEEQ